MIDERELSRVLTNEINNAQGYDGDVLSSLRTNAFGYYYGQLPSAPGNGRSGIVSTDVADAVHSLLAQIQPMIKGTMIEFEPESEQDEPQAQTETDFVTKMIERAGGYTAIFNSIHDAFLAGTSWLKVYVDDSTKDVEEIYPPELPDEALFMLSQPTAENQQVKVSITDKQTKVTRSTTTYKLVIKGVAPETIIFNNQIDDHPLRFIAERKVFTVSELKDYGFSQQKIDELPDANNLYQQAQNARQGIYGDTYDEPQEDSEQLKEVYCCYINLDKGNKTSELRHVWIGGSTILLNEPAEYIPFVWGSAIPVPHRIQGISLYEVLKSIQDGKTEILRNYLDNLAAQNLGRIGAVEGQVNMGDLTNGRINGVVRMRSPDAVIPLPSPDIGQQSLGGLGYLDTVRVQRIGASMDVNELQAQLMQSSATAAAGVSANIEKMAGWYANNLVETLIKPLFLLVHKVLRLDYAQTVNAKAKGQWTQQDTSQWPERENTTVNLGLTSLEKAQRINALGQVIQQQTAVIEMGGMDILTSLGKAYNSMSDWIRANDLGDPNSYLIDPDTPEAQQTVQENEQKKEQEKQQIFQMQQQLTKMQQDFEMMKQKQDLEHKKWERMMDAEEKEAELTTDLIIAEKKAQVDLIEGVRTGENQK